MLKTPEIDKKKMIQFLYEIFEEYEEKNLDFPKNMPTKNKISDELQNLDLEKLLYKLYVKKQVSLSRLKNSEVYYDLIDKVTEIIDLYQINHLNEWSNLDDFASISKLDGSKLLLLYKELMEFNQIQTQQTQENDIINEINSSVLIDSIEIVNRFKHGDTSIQRKEEKHIVVIEDSQWHNLLSVGIKNNFPEWKKDSIDLFFNRLKQSYKNGNKSIEITIAISNLSELIHAREEMNREEEAVNVLETIDDSEEQAAAEIIAFRVESIILPHIEVIEKNIKAGGKLIFLDLWESPFTESLKNRVRERDRNRCVVCEGEVDLHIHHKIPRNLGGVHHEDNLVTLCASCHGVVEQANVQKAIIKCLSNFRKNRALKLINWDLPVDRTVLRKQIEDKLDSLLSVLSVKNHELATEVIEIMTRFEQLFKASD